jgi:hypothetical protein
MLPEVSVALLVAVVFLRWGLLNTALGLILAHLTMALPVAAWVLTTTFRSIPREVQEAAVDGCDAWRTLTSIMLPWRSQVWQCAASLSGCYPGRNLRCDLSHPGSQDHAAASLLLSDIPHHSCVIE